MTNVNVTNTSILDNKQDKIDPYKYLFTANPIGNKSVLSQPPKHFNHISKPSLYMPMPSLKDVQPKFDEYIDLNSLQPKLNPFHTQEYLNSF